MRRRARDGVVLDRQALARVAAALWVGSGVLVVITGAFLPLGERADRPVVVAVGVLAVLIGGIVWSLPWNRWPDWATLALVPLAFAEIAAFNRAADDPWLYSLFFLVVFMWVGLAHPPGTSLAAAPLLIPAYVLPLVGRMEDERAVAALVAVLPVCVIVGEASAWVWTRLRRAEEARSASQALYSALVSHASEVVMILDESRTITYANPAVQRVLRLDPSEVIGRRAHELVHPDDVAVARYHFDRSLERRGDRPGLWRVRHGDGGWRWIENVVRDLREEPAVRGIVVNGRDVSERVAAEAELAHFARHDFLSGLPNRSAFLDELTAALARRDAGGRGVAVLFLDLDGFKVVNDSLGHAVGDAFLVAVAERLRANVRDDEHLARLGGDEFTIVAEHVTELEAAALADRIVTALQEPVEIEGRRQLLTASVGVAIAMPGELEPSQMLRHADLAMYRAKELGKNRYEIFHGGLETRARRRLDVEAQMRLGLDGNEFLVHFQPELDSASHAVVGMEALVRWQHPVRGLLAPGDFIDVAEDSGFIVRLGEHVLRQACATATRWWRELGDDAPTVGVNVSARQLSDPAFPELVADVLTSTSLPPAKLRLEIIESLLIDAVAPLALTRLKALGVELAIDDFGTGYSSLSYLDRLPVDVVKIDQSFLQAVTSADDRAPVIEATIAMAHSLDLLVVAEGVETHEQHQWLLRHGCQRLQGYLFGRPADEESSFAALLAGRAAEVLPGKEGPFPEDPPRP